MATSSRTIITTNNKEACPEELSLAIDQDDGESELLLHFLESLKEQKQKDASKLVEDIQCFEGDIEEIERRHPSKHLAHDDSSVHGKQNVSVHREPSSSDKLSQLSPVSNTSESRLMKNMSQLENAYFSMRSNIQLPETDVVVRQDNELLKNRDSWYLAQKDEEKQNSSDCLGAFFDGLCKYARYSKFEVRRVVRNGEFSNSSNVICSLSFDRDEDYFAAAGASKKIKIFEFNSLLNDFVDIHYPVIEMSNKSKISCVSWNNYIKNYLASTDYDGAVKLWDASTGQVFSQYNEHEKRAWSVDFSKVYTTKLANGSDDFSVKLWSINEKNCLGTIRSLANVCCVQFSAHSTHLLAFGSADYRTYCYDLRYAKTPWCVLAGHGKAVSYVKFLDSETLVSASTDNTLKLWDLRRSLSANACSLTFTDHTNEKIDVGIGSSSFARGVIDLVLGYVKSLVIDLAISIKVEVPRGRGKPSKIVDKDEGLEKFDAAKLRKLRPSFKQNEGSVIAGNASIISDSAAALVLVSGEKALQLGLQVIAKIKGYADAAQESLNVHGGAVSLGHPLGCSGAHILVTLLGVLRHRKGKYGVGAICNGGRGASSLVLELICDKRTRKGYLRLLESSNFIYFFVLKVVTFNYVEYLRLFEYLKNILLLMTVLNVLN